MFNHIPAQLHSTVCISVSKDYSVSVILDNDMLERKGSTKDFFDKVIR